MITFREVAFGNDEYQKLLDLRTEVLRKPLGQEMRPKDVATDANEYHLAAFDNNIPIACALLRPTDTHAAQIRQVAVLDNYQGQSIGKKMIGFTEEFAQEKGFTSIATRARKTAQGFYESLGYLTRAHEFEDEHTIKMVKEL